MKQLIKTHAETPITFTTSSSHDRIQVIMKRNKRGGTLTAIQGNSITLKHRVPTKTRFNAILDYLGRGEAYTRHWVNKAKQRK